MKSFRKEKEVSLETMAKYTGCSVDELSLWEDAKIDIPQDKIDLIIEFIRKC